MSFSPQLFCIQQKAYQSFSYSEQGRAKNAGIEQNVTAMTFRHTFATHMFEGQVEVDDIKEMLDHELDTETCIYIHVSLDSARTLLNAHQANPFFKGYRK